MLKNSQNFSTYFNKYFWDCAKTTTIGLPSAVFFDYNRIKNWKMYFLQEWRIFVFIIFWESLTEILKSKLGEFLSFNWCTTTLENASKLYAACKSFFLMENKNQTLINKHHIS
jgi:hypothetical protein